MKDQLIDLIYETLDIEPVERELGYVVWRVEYNSARTLAEHLEERFRERTLELLEKYLFTFYGKEKLSEKDEEWLEEQIGGQNE